MSSPPPWLSVVGPSADVTAMPAALDDGERATIALATAIQADLLLMDDRAGVAAARSLGFAVTGTLGILDRAARRGLLDLAAAFVALKATNFHSRQDLLDILLAAWRNDMSR
jgi:predicted nucleic acid-binding protein